MAIVKDEEEQKGQGTSQVLGQGMAQPGQQPPQPQQAQEASSAPAMIGGSAPQASAQTPSAPKQQKAGTGTFANLKTYLQAAQGGGQQRVAQAATQQVQRLGAGAQKGLQQAQKAFETRMQAGSGAVFQGAKPGEYLTTEQASEQARTRASDIIGAARKATYEIPELQNQYNISKDALSLATSNLDNRRKQIEELSGEGQQFLESRHNAKRRAELMQSVPALEEEVAKAQAEFSPIEKEYQTQLQQRQYVSPEQQQRFAEIINAQYQGPESLQQAGLYEQAAQKARTAQQAAQLTQTAMGREQLLKDVFGRTRDYGRGLSKLDALLLNASQQGVQQLQQQAEPALRAQEALQAEQNLSANTAAQRAQAIQQIASGARTAFTEGRTAEERATQKRIDDMIKTPAKDESGNPIQKLDAQGKPMVDAEGKPVYMTEWDRLPEYFRNIIRTAPETNKKIQEEGIKKLEESTGLSGKRFDELPGQISKIQKKIDDLERIARSSSKRQSNAAKNQIANLNNSLKSLQGEFASYKDFGTQLQGLRNMDMKQLRLSPEEMATLGISSGEGLYNLGQDLIGNVEAREENLITKDELSRQLALAQLAGLDTSNQLAKTLRYTDLEKAGTQDLLSSLDKKAIRESLNKAEKDFREYAGGKTVTGQGMKKDKVTGDKYRVSAQTNLKDALKKLGYDFESDLPKYQAPELSKTPSTSELETDKNTIIDDITENIKPTVDFNKTLDPYTDSDSTLARKGGYAAADYGTLGITAGLRGLGLDMPGAIMSGIDTALGTSIFGGGGNPSKNIKTAAEQAKRNLIANFQSTLENEGFYNRAALDESQISLARQKALMDLLNRKG